MSENRLSKLTLGLIIFSSALVQFPSLKLLLPDFGIEDEGVVLQGFAELASGNYRAEALFKYPGLLVFLLVLFIYPLNLVYQIRAWLHLQTFADFKFLFWHQTLSPASILYLGRLLSLMAGLLSIWFFYLLFRPRIGTRPALFGCLFLASSPAWLFSSSVFKTDSFLLLSLLILLLACFGILEQGRDRDYALSGIVLGLGLALKFHFFGLIPVVYAHRLRFSELSFRKTLFKRQLFFCLVLAMMVFFVFNPIQFFHPQETVSRIIQEIAIQWRGHGLLKASSRFWHLPILFQIFCAFPFAFGILAYLLAIPGFWFCPSAFGKPGFRLFISYPLVFFLGWALLSRLGFPHLYLPFMPFLAVSAGLFLDQLFAKKIWSQVLGLVLLFGSLLYNLACFRELNNAQARIVHQSLEAVKKEKSPQEKIYIFFPYRVLAGSEYLLDFQFQPQFQLTEKWLKQNQPEKILIHQTSYLSYLDNPELKNPASETFFALSQGKLGYQKVREWKAPLKFARIYQYLFPDLKYFSVGLYQKADALP